MATLADVVAADAEVETEIQAVAALVRDLNAAIADLQAQIAGGAIDQATLDSLAASLGAQAAELAALLPPPAEPPPEG